MMKSFRKVDCSQLPGPILGLVFGFLSLPDVLGACHLVCTHWKKTKASWTKLDLSPAQNDPAVAGAILAASLCHQIDDLQIEATLLMHDYASKLSNLKRLRLNTDHYREENPQPNCSQLVRHFQKLEALELGNYFVQDRSELKALSSVVPFLQELGLMNTYLEREMIDFSEFRALQCLSLDIGVCDEDLKTLTGLPLRSLSLFMAADITDSGLLHVGSITTLEVLGLSIVSRITNSGLQNLQALTALQSLKFGAEQLTDAGLPHLASFHSSLQHLNLSCSKLTGEGFAEKFEAAKFVVLKSLNLSYCSGLKHLEHLRELPTLSRLDLQGCRLLTLDHVLMLIDSLRDLLLLNLADCAGLTKADKYLLEKRANKRLSVYCD